MKIFIDGQGEQEENGFNLAEMETSYKIWRLVAREVYRLWDPDKPIFF